MMKTILQVETKGHSSTTSRFPILLPQIVPV